MQKLLQRTPSRTYLCSSTPDFHSHSPFLTKTHKFFSLSLSSSRLFTSKERAFSSVSMNTATALGGSGGLGSSLSLSAAVIPSARFSGCRCAVDFRSCGPKTKPFRAWGVGRPAWFCTVAGGEGPVATAVEAAVEGKGIRAGRRQKEMVGNGDLLTIPGVGPKNLRKLVDKGFRGMAELKQFYKDKFLGKSSDNMVEYLQSNVGIIHKNHAESITTFIKQSVDEELEDTESDMKPLNKKKITFCVEGNISVGKTTFLQRIVSDTIELRDLVEVVPEPIDKWQDIGPDHFNILDAFYAEPHRYAYTFQNYVFVTRVMQERESSAGVKPLRLMERSVFSDRMVFVRAVHEAKWMNEMEINIYDSWFDPVVSVLPGLVPDGFIYLRASPDTCHKRLKLRKRAEEGGVTLDYLRDLHDKHESWLFPFESGNHGVLSVSQPPLHLDSSLHPDIRDRVFLLEGDHMHSCIQKVPALVLDCEANIDLNKDVEAKAHYARQVSEFFKYVQSIKESIPAEPSGGGPMGSQRKVLLPHEGGLLLPNGKHFPNAALKSLDFRRAMSLMTGQ